MDNETKIIKHGIFFSNPVRFKCECGCVYDTTDISVNIFDNYGGPKGSKVASCYSRCPECLSANNATKYFMGDDPRNDR